MILSSLPLMPAAKLVSLIKSIEQRLPGYWYSISQKADRVRISLAPTQYCLLDTDRQWAMTKEGDTGLHVELTPDAIVSTSTEVILHSAFFGAIDLARSEMERQDGEKPRYAGQHRAQSKDALTALKKSYTQLMTAIPSIEARYVIIEEVYLGSCQLSVDCSIRGTLGDGTAFDHSCDYTGPAILAESVGTALEELKAGLFEKVA